MCGIAGIACPDPAGRSPRLVRSMLDQLVHRGPDEEGVLSGGGATIGARRLAIIDLIAGQQPMANEDATVIAVQNGELYNFASLREELVAKGHILRTRNDTEIIPHLYEEHGTDLFARLRGMFAIAIWDDRRRRLVLARDRVGKKPIVYTRWRDGLAFASEISALLALGVDREIDRHAIAEYLTYGYVPAPRSAFARVKKVQPGSVLVFEGGEVTERRYWMLSYEPKVAWTRAEAVARVREKMEESVRIRLMSDVPLGVLLSGGLDSSAVVAFASRHSLRPVQTFSIGFGVAAFDELRYARIVSKAFATDHHEFVVEPSAADVLPMLVRHYGEPFADSSAIPTYHVARLARQHVTVTLNGDGGDEVFGGYPRYRAVALAAMLDRAPLTARLLNGLAGLLPPRVGARRRVARLRRLLNSLAATPDERYFRWMAYFGGSRGGVLGEGVRSDRTGAAWLARAADDAGARDLVDRAMAADLLTYLPGDLLVKMDIATMACSLEARSPFLDHELIEMVARLPRAMKADARRTKTLMRNALAGVLPEAILSRGKMGFGVPVGDWIRGPLRDLVHDTVMAPSSFTAGLVRPDEIQRLLVQHERRETDHTPLLWAVLMLELWYRQVASERRVTAMV